MRLNEVLLGVFMTVAAVAPAMAQAPVTGVADPEALAEYYGDAFDAAKLPARDNIELIPKRELSIGLGRATRKHAGGRYHKLRHGPEILKLLDVRRVRDACPHCDRLFVTLESLLGAPHDEH